MKAKRKTTTVTDTTSTIATGTNKRRSKKAKTLTEKAEQFEAAVEAAAEAVAAKPIQNARELEALTAWVDAAAAEEKDTMEEAAAKVKLTDGCHALFSDYAHDAQNWSGYPWTAVGNVDGGSMSNGGRLGALKRLGLIVVGPYDREVGDTFIIFTVLGKAFAKTRLGINLDWIVGTDDRIKVLPPERETRTAEAAADFEENDEEQETLDQVDPLDCDFANL